MPPPTLAAVTNTDNATVCKLCFRPAQALGVGLKLGQLYSFGHCQAHLYCLMFSSGLEQNGEEEEGIKGFLVDDIVKEWRRGSRLKCFYCKQTYATVGCVGKGCKKGYHLPCGMENGSLQQFFGDFSSHCETHRPVQSPHLVKREASSRGECGVCLEQLEERPDSGVLWTPCCGVWFHRICVERMAETAGCHFFKCPLCNNREQFSEEMQLFGIYLPDKDAEWETGSAYDDQYERHGSCDAVSCLCPDGNQYDEDDTAWEIILCSCCGAQGIHVECGQLSKPRWKCRFCREVVANLPCKPVSVFTRVKRGNKGHSVNLFARNVLENLSFKISSNEVTVEVFKNKVDTIVPAVATFVVTAVPDADTPFLVKVFKDDLTIKTEDNIQETEAVNVESISDETDVIAGCESKEKVPLDAVWPVVTSTKALEPINHANTDESAKKVSLTPLLGSSSKKRRISPPVGQPSILNFFKYSLSSTEIDSPTAGQKKSSLVQLTGPESPRDINAISLACKHYTDKLEYENDKNEEKKEMYSCYMCEIKTKLKNNFARHLISQHGDSIKLKPATTSKDIDNDAYDIDVLGSICQDPVMPGDANGVVADPNMEYGDYEGYDGADGSHDREVLDNISLAMGVNDKNKDLSTTISEVVSYNPDTQLWKCTVCERTNSFECHIRRHAEVHFNGFIHSCPHCDVEKKTSNALNIHIHRVHTKKQ